MYRFNLMIFFLVLTPWLAFGQSEICDNGIDDDADNLIDLNDPDCACLIVEPVSVIPNPSFEDRNCCPTDRSQLDCADLWIQASAPTTDFIHTCDWLGWDEFPPPRPFPDGEGIMGFRDGRVRSDNEAEPFWKEYAGACLLSPLLTDSMYRFQFDVGFVNPERSPPIDVSFFGTTDCVNLPFGGNDIAFGCPSNSPDWVKLGEVRVSGVAGNRWVNTFIEIIPSDDIYAIAIGPDCNPIRTPVSLYYFFDNLLLTDIASFNFQIREIMHPCSETFTLSIPNSSEFEYQWYLDGIALAGETSAELSQNYGEGIYQVRVLDGLLCQVSSKYEYVKPRFTSAPRIAICQGESFSFGDLQITTPGFYLDTFKTRENCDSIVSLELEVIGDTYDTLEVSILEGESFDLRGESFEIAGDYPLTFNSSLGCDSLVLLQLTNFKIYIPNVFSPDNNGINDLFAPLAKSDIIQSLDIRIFNRWGELLFQGTEWNGGEEQPGVYVYIVDISFSNGRSKAFHGSVTLVK